MHLPGQLQGSSRAALVARGLLALLTLAIITSTPGALVGIALMAAGVCWLRSMQRARTLTRSKLIDAISVAALGTLSPLPTQVRKSVSTTAAQVPSRYRSIISSPSLLPGRRVPSSLMNSAALSSPTIRSTCWLLTGRATTDKVMVTLRHGYPQTKHSAVPMSVCRSA